MLKLCDFSRKMYLIVISDKIGDKEKLYHVIGNEISEIKLKMPENSYNDQWDSRAESIISDIAHKHDMLWDYRIIDDKELICLCEKYIGKKEMDRVFHIEIDNFIKKSEGVD